MSDGVPLYAQGQNFVFRLDRGVFAFPSLLMGGGPSRLFDKGSVVIVDASFPPTADMRLLGKTTNGVTMQLLPAPP